MSVPHPSVFFSFFFNDTATTEIYTLSLHDALPICAVPGSIPQVSHQHADVSRMEDVFVEYLTDIEVAPDRKSTRLNSSHVRISYAVFCLKKKKKADIIDMRRRLKHHYLL